MNIFDRPNSVNSSIGMWNIDMRPNLKGSSVERYLELDITFGQKREEGIYKGDARKKGARARGKRAKRESVKLLTSETRMVKQDFVGPRQSNKKRREYRSRCSVHSDIHFGMCVRTLRACERMNKMSPSADTSTIISIATSERAGKG